MAICKGKRRFEAVMRINRFLARAGVASRRASDRLIQEGLVRVNGEVATPGVKVDPLVDEVVYQGRVIQDGEPGTYLILNKPPGYLVSAGDPHHRRTVFELLKGVTARVFPVGRLDLDTWGVLLLTNDGDLNFRLTHPRYGVEKVYHARVRGIPHAETLRRLREGVLLEGVQTAPAAARLVQEKDGNGWIELVLHEGRKRQVKQMLAAVGHPIRRLERISFGGLTATGLKPGCWRHLTTGEIQNLRHQVGLS
ncbi:MAG: pseudouridine synthase [bacterium]|nr:pseudouridine synthase [bacterium]